MNTTNSNPQYYSTRQAAEHLGIKIETLHHSMWRNGHYYDIVPVKMPNRRLLWAVSDLDDLIAKHA